MGSNGRSLSTCVLSLESVKRKIRISVRERVWGLTKKMRAEAPQSRGSGDEGKGSGVDFGGEDLKEAVDSKPEPTVRTYLGCTTTLSTRWGRGRLSRTIRNTA